MKTVKHQLWHYLRILSVGGGHSMYCDGSCEWRTVPAEYVILDDFLVFYPGYTRALLGVLQWSRVFHILNKSAICWCNCTLPEVLARTCTGSFSCFCLSLGSRTPWGLFTRGSSYPGVFSSCIVLKHLSQTARFPLFTDFFSNCDFSRILCTDY